VRVFNRPDVPSLDGATEWLNTEPLGLPGLGGRVVLVNFWTLTCINWLRAEPYVRAWSQTYADDGLVVIGVHTPEFSFEHDPALVRQASAQRDIDYPVAVDNDYAIWSSFDNHYWPALYFLDREGTVRDFHFGEGRYAGSERVLQKLLGLERDLTYVQGVGVEADADWRHLRSPETYLGSGRSSRFSSPAGVVADAPHRYDPPRRLRSNHWSLTGQWTIGQESVVLAEPLGSISFRFHARDAHMVLANDSSDPIPFRVTVDGEPPGPSHGLDVDEAGDGVLDEARMYQLIRQRGRIRERTLAITFTAPGAAAYSFTFG
jgi:thiol-disulfide isomerase/thioredoxin